MAIRTSEQIQVDKSSNQTKSDDLDKELILAGYFESFQTQYTLLSDEDKTQVKAWVNAN